ncbi:MAG: ribonuclease Z [Bradymonadaceae bacterium]|nr:ribonuclease Z [Lujinxingiaceae bacterium]
MQLVFLGTGSGKPTPQRNVSSMALFRDGELFLFDCGESTQIQMAKSVLRPGALKAIFLTHFHGDHVNGLPGLVGSQTLNQRHEALDIVGPRGLKRWLKCLRELNILWPGFQVRSHEVTEPGIVFEHPEFHIESVALKHRIETWGYALVERDRPGRFDLEGARALGVPHGPMYGRLQRGEAVTLEDGRTVLPQDVLGPPRAGLKIVYCTDTSPCAGAIELARNADVLVHEATYPGGDERLAHERGHSTAADAARCALEAGAKKLVLTHISQKYVRPDIFLEHARAIFPNTVIAQDFFELEVKRRDD